MLPWARFGSNFLFGMVCHGTVTVAPSPVNEYCYGFSSLLLLDAENQRPFGLLVGSGPFGLIRTNAGMQERECSCPERNELRGGEAAYRCTKRLGRTLLASGDHQLPGGGSGSASCPMDGVRQTRIP